MTEITNENTNGLKLPVEVPDMPRSLSDGAKIEWERVTKWLKAINRVALLDAQALTAYCQYWDDFSIKASRLMSREEEYFRFMAGKDYPTPFADQACEDARRLIELSKLFGLTPANRRLDDAKSDKIPDELAELRGNPSKIKLRPHFADTYFVDGWPESENKPPEWFDDDAVLEWQRLRKGMGSTGLFTPLDYVPVAVTCALYSMCSHMSILLQSTGFETHSEKSGKAYSHPLVGLLAKYWNVLRPAWAQLAMTPLDRKKFSDAQDDKDDALEIDPSL